MPGPRQKNRTAESHPSAAAAPVKVHLTVRFSQPLTGKITEISKLRLTISDIVIRAN
jgi:hypothetical protein